MEIIINFRKNIFVIFCNICSRTAKFSNILEHFVTVTAELQHSTAFAAELQQISSTQQGQLSNSNVIVAVPISEITMSQQQKGATPTDVANPSSPSAATAPVVPFLSLPLLAMWEEHHHHVPFAAAQPELQHFRAISSIL